MTRDHFRGRDAEAAAGEQEEAVAVAARVKSRGAPGLERPPVVGLCGALGSPRHEHRRGIPHPPQLPLGPAAGQREAGSAGRAASAPGRGQQCAGRGGGSALPCFANHGWAGDLGSPVEKGMWGSAGGLGCLCGENSVQGLFGGVCVEGGT